VEGERDLQHYVESEGGKTRNQLPSRGVLGGRLAGLRRCYFRSKIIIEQRRFYADLCLKEM